MYLLSYTVVYVYVLQGPACLQILSRREWEINFLLWTQFKKKYVFPRRMVYYVL